MELPLTKTKLWCVCLQPERNRCMIVCEKCTNWYHIECMGLTKAVAETVPEWVCPKCFQLEEVVLKPLRSYFDDTLKPQETLNVSIQTALTKELKPLQDSLDSVQNTIQNIPKVREYKDAIKVLQSKNGNLKNKIIELQEVHQSKVTELQDKILKLQSENVSLVKENEVHSNRILKLEENIANLKSKYVSKKKCLKKASQPSQYNKREASLSEEDFKPRRKK